MRADSRRRLVNVAVVVVLVLSCAASPVMAQAETPPPTTDDAPAEAPTTASSTPAGANNSTATAPNGSAGPVPSSGESGLFGWLFGGEDKARTQGASLVQQAALTVIAGIAFVPAPNNAQNAYMAPTNGMWEDRWNFRQNTVMPLFWFLVLAFLVIALLDEVVPLLPERVSRGKFRRLARGTVLGYFSATIAGMFLNLRRGVTMLLLQDVTASTVEAQIASGVVLLAVIILFLADAWAILTLVLIVGGVIVAIPAAYPWLPILYILGAAPSRGTQLIAMVLRRAWYVLGGLTLPIAALVGTGFSIEVTPHINEANMALSAGQYNRFLTEAVTSILTFAATFGSIALGVLLAHKLLGVLDLGGAAGLPQVIPQKQDVKVNAQAARERAGVAYNRAKAPVEGGRRAVNGVREGKHREVATSVRSRLGGVRSDGGEPRDSGTGADRQRRVREHMAERRRGAQDTVQNSDDD